MKRTPREVTTTVAKFYGYTYDQLVAKGKRQSLANARKVAYYLLRKVLCLSYPDIGFWLDRDHTTAMRGCKWVGRVLADPGARDHGWLVHDVRILLELLDAQPMPLRACESSTAVCTGMVA